MNIETRGSAKITAALMFAVVTTQIIYFALSSSGADINRMIIWTTEAVAFLGIAVLALVCVARSRHASLAWAAIAVSGTLNVIQVGMGLAMFGPLSDAGDALAPAFKSVLAGAFFLYFAGKFLFAFAAIVIGAGLLRGGSASKAVGALSVLAGCVGMVINLGAMAVGMDLVFAAGAAGTVVTLMLGIAIIASARTMERL